jgi:hypothetical protein
MQNGLTANQAKHTKNHGNFFWTNHSARRKVKIRNGMGGKTSRPLLVRPPIMITLQPINEFKKLDGKVYWGRHIINGADFDSFEP